MTTIAPWQDFSNQLRWAKSSARPGKPAVVNLRADEDYYFVDAGTVYGGQQGQAIGPESIQYTPGFKIYGNGARVWNEATTPFLRGIPRIGTQDGIVGIASDVLGVELRGENGNVMQRFHYQDIDWMGMTSTPATTGKHYVGLRILSNRITMFNTRQEHTVSATANLTNRSPYNSHKVRGNASYAPVAVGQDRNEQPDVRRAIPCRGMEIRGWDCVGEPLSLSGENPGDGRVIGLSMRKVANYDITGVRLGHVFTDEDTGRTISDMNFSGQPVAGNTFQVNQYDPFDQRWEPIIYTWAASAASAHEVTIGASLSLSMANARAAVNLNSKNNGGSEFVECIDGFQVLGAVANMLRFQTIIYKVGAFPVVCSQPYYNYVPDAGSAEFLVITAGAYATAAARQKGQYSLGHFKYGIFREDCPFGHISPIDASNTACEFQDIALSTGPLYDFSPNVESEGHHTKNDGMFGDRVVATKAAIAIYGGGFTDYGPITVGQVGITAGSKAVHVRKGIHYRDALALTAGNYADGDIVTLVDGEATPRTVVFEADNNAATTGGRVAFTIGATFADSQRNLRIAIEQQRIAGNINYFTEDLQLVGGIYQALYVTCFTYGPTFANTPSTTKTSANLSIFVDSAPYRPAIGTIDYRGHWPSDANGFSTPAIVLEDITEHASVRAALMHTRPINSGAQSAMELWSLTSAITGVPGAAEKFSIRGTNAGSRVDFTFTTGTDLVTAAKTYYIGNRGPITTIDECLRAVAKTINDAMADVLNTDWALYGAMALYADGAVSVTKGREGEVDTAFITKTGANLDVTSARLTTSLASTDTLGMLAAIVVNDCDHVSFDLTGSPWEKGSYSAGSLAFTQKYNEISDTGLDPKVMAGFGGLPQFSVYVKKSSATQACKIDIRTAGMSGPWGPARRGKRRFVLLGANMAETDYAIGSCFIDGVLVSAA